MTWEQLSVASDHYSLTNAKRLFSPLAPQSS